MQHSERVCVATGTGITNGCQRGPSRTPGFGARINAHRRPPEHTRPPRRPRHLSPPQGWYVFCPRPPLALSDVDNRYTVACTYISACRHGPWRD